MMSSERILSSGIRVKKTTKKAVRSQSDLQQQDFSYCNSTTLVQDASTLPISYLKRFKKTFTNDKVIENDKNTEQENSTEDEKQTSLRRILFYCSGTYLHKNSKRVRQAKLNRLFKEGSKTIDLLQDELKRVAKTVEKLKNNKVEKEKDQTKTESISNEIIQTMLDILSAEAETVDSELRQLAKMLFEDIQNNSIHTSAVLIRTLLSHILTQRILSGTIDSIDNFAVSDEQQCFERKTSSLQGLKDGLYGLHPSTFVNVEAFDNNETEIEFIQFRMNYTNFKQPIDVCIEAGLALYQFPLLRAMYPFSF